MSVERLSASRFENQHDMFTLISFANASGLELAASPPESFPLFRTASTSSNTTTVTANPLTLINDYLLSRP
ncbi:hypothetical protein LIA77_04179 [Sarocladium implicatum]|nr:hypothetical protein LIA77_04179 [Sarocladium implicatum]